MIAVKTSDITQNFKQIADNVFQNGEKVLIARPRNENLVLLTEAEYNRMEKAQRNSDYFAMLDESVEQAKNVGTYEFVNGKFGETPQKKSFQKDFL